ncbi:MAG: hypothetical protein ACJ71Q_01285 [Terriglobales bacterium]|jgi:hypothetical protein
MGLPEKRDELNRVDEQTALNRLDDQSCQGLTEGKIEERYAIEDREYRDERHRDEHRDHGHEFARDVHPERYPRESLSRLEEGILEDDELRHSHDRLAHTGPDLESRIGDTRNLSRTLVVLGSCLLIFAWVLLLWVGWDVRSGQTFFITMCAVAIAAGLGLIVWGYIERQRVMGLRTRLARPIEDRIEQARDEHSFRESDHAA